MGRVLVVGAGIGGLAAAIRLASGGCSVTVCDNNGEPGGKANTLQIGDWRFDSGPSLLTMPEVFDDLFAAAGASFRDCVSLQPLDVVANYFLGDGRLLRAYGDRGRFVREASAVTGEAAWRIDAFLRYSERIHGVVADLFLTRSLADLRTWLLPRFWWSLMQIWKIDPLRSMYSAICSYLRTAALRQFFCRYATYNGSDPYRAPATLNIIPHVELIGGAYGVVGGIHAIPRAMCRLAADRGVRFRFNTVVERLVVERRGGRRVVGARIGGRDHPYDAIVSNADIDHTYGQLLGDRQARDYLRYRRHAPSSSGLVFYWGMRRRFERLRLHNLFFSDDYRSEFVDIFDRQVCPQAPTIYLNIGCRTSPADAPPDGENWFVLINAPSDCGQDWTQQVRRVRAFVIERLRTILRCDIESHIAVERIVTPPDIARTTGSNGGRLYGIASNTIGAAFGRHANRSRHYRGLYFCGGSSHPGGGMPLAALSGTIAADLLRRDLRRRPLLRR